MDVEGVRRLQNAAVRNVNQCRLIAVAVPLGGERVLQKIIDFIAKLFGVKRKSQSQKKASTDDIYPLW